MELCYGIWRKNVDTQTWDYCGEQTCFYHFEGDKLVVVNGNTGHIASMTVKEDPSGALAYKLNPRTIVAADGAKGLKEFMSRTRFSSFVKAICKHVNKTLAD